jgi:predicted phage terminase large subunit-like protein
MIWLTQYQQEPTAEQGEIFHNDWWRAYDHIDHINSRVVFDDGSVVPFHYKAIYADTAMKIKEKNDFSSLQCWVYLADDRIALIDNETAKWEAPDLEDNFLAFCDRWDFQIGVINMGVRTRKVEDKASGTGLIQAVNKMRGDGWVEGIPRDTDKVSRAKSCAPQIKKGKVLLPPSAPWLKGYLTEFQKFNSMMTHKHDDQIDATLDAINDMLIDSPMIGYNKVVGGK